MENVATFVRTDELTLYAAYFLDFFAWTLVERLVLTDLHSAVLTHNLVLNKNWSLKCLYRHVWL